MPYVNGLMCNGPESDWQHRMEIKKINSTCSQGIYCVCDHKLRPYLLSPGCQASYLGLWKFLYWRWVMTSHQRGILLLILSSWALIRASPWLQHASGILALGSKDVWRCKGIFECPLLPLPRSVRVKSCNHFYVFGTSMHQEHNVFSNHWVSEPIPPN